MYRPHSRSCQITAGRAGEPTRREADLTTSCPPPHERPAAHAARAWRCRWAARTAARPGRAGSRRPVRAPPEGLARRGSRRDRRPAYFIRTARSGARVPLQVTRRTRPASSSKSASQIQDTSRPSAMLSLSTPSRSWRPGSSVSVRSTSFAPAGFLTSRIRSSRGPAPVAVPLPVGRGEGEALRPPEGGADVGQPGGDRLQRDLQRARQGGRREGVVDVVEAGEVERHAGLAGGGAKRELRGPDAVQDDLAGGQGRVGRRWPQLSQW